MANTTSTKSRFSTLNVFKLSSSSSSSSLGINNTGPPPLPPKDAKPYIASLYSKSSTTLQSPSISESPTLNSYGSPYAAGSPSSSSTPSTGTGLPFLTPNLSKVSLALSSGGDSSSRSVMSRKASSFFNRFGGGGKKKSSTLPPQAPPESDGDEGVSRPWNFQHQIHVNDGLMGLPPSWSAQLSQAGFSEEEIFIIQARRAASSSSPSIQLGSSSSASIRPASPATTLSSTYSTNRPQSPYGYGSVQTVSNANTGNVGGGGTRPAPRGSSLYRAQAQPNAAQSQQQIQPHSSPYAPYPLPTSTQQGMASSPHRSTPSLSGSSHRSTPSHSRSRRPSQSSISSSNVTRGGGGGELPPHPTRAPPPPPPINSSSASASGPENATALSTPPRRPLHLTNGSPSPMSPNSGLMGGSPPPAYPGGPLGAGANWQSDVKDSQLYNKASSTGVNNSTSPAPQRPAPGAPSSNADQASAIPPRSVGSIDAPRRKSKRFSTTRPPRLSLHRQSGEDSRVGGGGGLERSGTVSSRSGGGGLEQIPGSSGPNSSGFDSTFSSGSGSGSGSGGGPLGGLSLGGGLGSFSGFGLSLGGGEEEDKGWGDSVFEAISASAGGFDVGKGTGAGSGSGSLLPAIVLSPTTNGSPSNSANGSTSSTQRPSPSSTSTSTSTSGTSKTAPLTLIPSSSSPKSLSRSPSESQGEGEGDTLAVYSEPHKPGESSPMWDEIMEIMERKSPSASSSAAPSPSRGTTLPGIASMASGTERRKSSTPPDEDEDVDGFEDEEYEDETSSNTRFSTATLLASSFRPSERTHLAPSDTLSQGRGFSSNNRDSSQSTSSVISTATIKNVREVVDVTGRVVKASLVKREGTSPSLSTFSKDTTPSSPKRRFSASENYQDDERYEEDEVERDVGQSGLRAPSSPMSGSFGGSEETTTSRGTTATSSTNFTSSSSPVGNAAYPAIKGEDPGAWQDGDDEDDIYSGYLDDGEGKEAGGSDEGQEIVYDKSRFGLPKGYLAASVPYASKQQPAQQQPQHLHPQPANGGPPAGPLPLTPGAEVLSYYENRSPEPDRMDFVDEVLRTRDAFAGEQPDDIRASPPPPASPYLDVRASQIPSQAQSQERPRILVNGAREVSAPPSASNSPAAPNSLKSPSSSSSLPSPSRIYPGWLSELVKPLSSFVDESIVDPRQYYHELVEIAECESGSSVYAARVVDPEGSTAKALSKSVRERDRASKAATKAAMSQVLANGAGGAAGQVAETLLVAIKIVPMAPGGTPKLKDIQRELLLLKASPSLPISPAQSSASSQSPYQPIFHPNIIIPDSIYIDLVEDSLWLRMELMERSVADVIMLIEEGLMLQERMMARIAGDVLEGLMFLEKKRIAHRDLRSDNLLISRDGVVKIADFSSAIHAPTGTLSSEPTGVVYWQAPEMRSGPYNPMKVDVWSLGATVWEMAESQPPFSAGDTDPAANRVTVTDTWPALSKPSLFSPAFHEFLRICSASAERRPTAGVLVKSAFVLNACGRPVIVQLLSQCVAIEQNVQERENAALNA